MRRVDDRDKPGHDGRALKRAKILLLNWPRPTRRSLRQAQSRRVERRYDRRAASAGAAVEPPLQSPPRLVQRLRRIDVQDRFDSNGVDFDQLARAGAV
jgi:hypothetical protein